MRKEILVFQVLQENCGKKVCLAYDHIRYSYLSLLDMGIV